VEADWGRDGLHGRVGRLAPRGALPDTRVLCTFCEFCFL
jgi:hypothetical protein